MRFRLALVVLLLASCGEDPLPPWVCDTGVPFIDYGLVWMDDERLLFQRMEQVAPKTDPTDPWAAFTFPLTTWTIGGRRETLSSETIANPCYDRGTGRLSYLITPREGGPPAFRTGPPGAHVEGATGAAMPRALFNPFSCLFERWPEGLAKHVLAPLRPGDGIVDLGRPGHAGPARLVASDGQAIPLPFDRLTVSPTGFSADGDAYRVVADYRRSASCRRIWRLEPGRGAREEACLPEMTSDRVVRTALGWVMDKRDYGRDGGINDSGVFLVPDDGDPVKLAGGFTENLAVSPDGCRIAFGHAPDLETSCMDGTFRRKTVKVVDLCAHRWAILGD